MDLIKNLRRHMYIKTLSASGGQIWVFTVIDTVTMKTCRISWL